MQIGVSLICLLWRSVRLKRNSGVLFTFGGDLTCVVVDVKFGTLAEDRRYVGSVAWKRPNKQ